MLEVYAYIATWKSKNLSTIQLRLPILFRPPPPPGCDMFLRSDPEVSAVSRLCDSRMALLKYLKKKEEGSASLPTLGMLKGSSLTELQLRKANKAQCWRLQKARSQRRGVNTTSILQNS